MIDRHSETDGQIRVDRHGQAYFNISVIWPECTHHSSTSEYVHVYACTGLYKLNHQYIDQDGHWGAQTDFSATIPLTIVSCPGLGRHHQLTTASII